MEANNDLQTAQSSGNILFVPGTDLPWIMKLEEVDGGARVVFNRDDYPDAIEDDFADAVIKLLENHLYKARDV